MQGSGTGNEKSITRTLYTVSLAEEFPLGQLVGTILIDQPFVAWQDAGGKVHGLEGRCIHKRFQLARGRLLGDGTLECAYHSFRFNGCGACVGIPSLEDTNVRLDRIGGVRSYPVVEQDGVVWLWPDDAEPGAGPPPAPEIAGVGWDAEARGKIPWRPCTGSSNG